MAIFIEVIQDSFRGFTLLYMKIQVFASMRQSEENHIFVTQLVI